MGYTTLLECVSDLEKQGQLVKIDYPVDPNQEIGIIQRRAFAAQSPAILFSNPKGCKFPMLANLFGTRERVNYIFRDTLEKVKDLFEIAANPLMLSHNPLKAFKFLPELAHLRPKSIKASKTRLKYQCELADLPQLKSWPQDAGAFITLPLVYSRDPDSGKGNLGMYRVQLNGNDYNNDEVGLHYQIHRGIGVHHAKAINKNEKLAVNIHIGGPPALTLAAIMPLPEGLNELLFAAMLGGTRIEMVQDPILPYLGASDFVLQGQMGATLKPEGPFGDHLGYYSLQHPFPYLKVQAIRHRKNAIWPFTTVGRPPQEDTVFGDLIHELTAPMVSKVFSGIKSVHAVDVAGVHPLLLAIGCERYTPYETPRKPRELITLAMHLLGSTQTALAKYLLIAAGEDAPDLDIRNVGAFLQHMLERTNFKKDLHFITQSPNDTLDYTGMALHEGSKLIWASCGEKVRNLGREIHNLPDFPDGFDKIQLIAPGVIAVQAPKHNIAKGKADSLIETGLCVRFSHWRERENFPLVVLVDDVDFCSAAFANFLWLTFTRSDPATDTYGIHGSIESRHWSCEPPLIIDARHKDFYPAPLEENPDFVRNVENLAAKGKPFYGLF